MIFCKCIPNAKSTDANWKSMAYKTFLSKSENKHRFPKFLLNEWTTYTHKHNKVSSQCIWAVMIYQMENNWLPSHVQIQLNKTLMPSTMLLVCKLTMLNI